MAPKKTAQSGTTSAAADGVIGTATKRFESLQHSDGGTRLEFTMRGVDLGIVNAVRRALMGDVPTAAFRFTPYVPDTNGVIIKANSSCLHNEILGHRISLLPINFDANQLRVFDPTRWRFTLRARNTALGPNEMRYVTSADIEVHDHTGARYPPDVHAKLFPPCRVTGDHVLLLTLRPGAAGDGKGEEVHLECSASVGTGREHARWCPVSLCFFRYELDPAASARALEERLKAASEGGADARELEALRADWAALDAHRHFLRDAHGEPAGFRFVLETEASALTPEYLFFKALLVLHQRVRRVAQELRTGAADPTGAVVVRPVPHAEGTYEVELRGEDHTLGNLIQAVLYRHWVRDGGSADVSFVGYHQPHPLEERVVLKVRCVRPADNAAMITADGTDMVAALLLELAREWVMASGLKEAKITEVNAIFQGVA